MPTTPDANNLLFYSSFDGTDFLKTWIASQFCCSYSVTQNTSLKRSGAASLRFEANSTDPIVSKKHRSEIILPTDPSVNIDRWYGFSSYQENWASDAEPESIIQWHHSSADGSPPFAIWIKNNRYQVVHETTGTIDGNFLYDDIGAVESNKWTDWVFHIKWSTSSNGIIEIWRNGTKVFTYNGVTNYNLPEGNYMKLGIYKWPWTNRPGSSSVTKRVLYIDEFRIAGETGSYATVAPR